MANEEQLAILQQGVDVWNRWRKANPEAQIDLKGAELREAHLENANLARADLAAAYLPGAHLAGANFHGAYLYGATLRRATLGEAVLARADLHKADLTGARLDGANLDKANLAEADLRGAYLEKSNLEGTNFMGAGLAGAYFESAYLDGTNFRGAILRGSFFHRSQAIRTIFADLDLSEVSGLENVVHLGPSTIGTDTIAKSKGKIPEVFLRGCGLSDWEVESAKLYNPELSNDEVNRSLYRVYDLRASQAIQISPLFISYSHVDSTFVDKLESQLNGKGIRFWRDIHEMKAGRVEKQIDQAISQNRTVLLVLSEHSLNSDWVEHEVRTARELEKEMGHDVLCPVALDDSWKSSRWPKRIMEQIMEYNILDFSAWKDDSKFDGLFRKLIDGLELFYKG